MKDDLYEDMERAGEPDNLNSGALVLLIIIVMGGVLLFGSHDKKKEVPVQKPVVEKPVKSAVLDTDTTLINQLDTKKFPRLVPGPIYYA